MLLRSIVRGVKSVDQTSGSGRRKVTLLIYIREVPVYNLGRDTNYSEVLVFLHSPSGRMLRNYRGIIIGHDHFHILSN
jgi:hypothetical protein